MAKNYEWKDKSKRMDIWDIKLIKWAVAMAVLFLLAVWPKFAEEALSIHWGWYLGAFIILAIRPFVRVWCRD